jgi:D-alanyl-D-alanine dipeptidase
MQKRNKIFLGLGLATIAGIYFYNKNKASGSSAGTSFNTAVNKNINNKFGKNNASFINNLNPAAKQTFISFINDITKLGYAVVVTSAYRASKEQAALKKKNKKNATPGFSTHEYGIGIDLNLVKDGKWINKDTPLSTWRKTGVVDLAKNKYNMRWGGDFTGYLDPIHFDLGKKYDVNKLYAKALPIYGSAANIQGNKLKLV